MKKTKPNAAGPARKEKAQHKFPRTRRAITKIRHGSLRRDFAGMLDGVEFCLAHRRKALAQRCANALVAMTIGLNRTITPGVAVGVLTGLLEDTNMELAPLGLGYIEYHFDEACFHQECAESEGGICITIEGAGGCGNKTGFQMPWAAFAQ